MVKECLLILKKTSLINASFVFLSNDDFVKDKALVASSLKVEKVKKVKVAKAAEV